MDEAVGRREIPADGAWPRASLRSRNRGRTNNARKLLITNSTFTNDIRFLYFPPFATQGLVPLLHKACSRAIAGPGITLAGKVSELLLGLHLDITMAGAALTADQEIHSYPTN